MAFELTEQIEKHLVHDKIVWLTTVTPGGRPAPRPVWFVWDGASFVIYSQPHGAKIKHIAANDQVTLIPKQAFALTKPVQLQVDGLPPSGLEDSFGRLIDGDHSGQPGSNAVALLNRKGATISAVVSSRPDKVARF